MPGAGGRRVTFTLGPARGRGPRTSLEAQHATLRRFRYRNNITPPRCGAVVLFSEKLLRIGTARVSEWVDDVQATLRRRRVDTSTHGPQKLPSPFETRRVVLDP